MLHIVSNSDSDSAMLANCLSIVRAGDSILLVREGVYGGLRSRSEAKQIEDLANAGVCQFYALETDVEAYQIAANLLPCVRLIEYSDFLQLTIDHPHSQSWF